MGGVEPGAGPRELARGWLTIATRRAVGAACCLLTGLAWPSLEPARGAHAGHGGCRGGTTVAHTRTGRLFYTGEAETLYGCLYAFGRRRVLAVSSDGMAPDYFDPSHSALAGTYAATDLVSTVLNGNGDGGPQSSVLVEQLRTGRRHTIAAWHGARDACKPRYGNDPCVEELLALVLAPTGQAAWIVVDTTIDTTLSSQPFLSDPAATFAVYAMSASGVVNLLDSNRQIDPHSLRLSRGRPLSWVSGGTTHWAPLP